MATAEFCSAGSATYDSVLAAWSGTCGALSQLACNDDFCGLSSHITFGVLQGTTYYISVGGFVGSTGNFNLSVFCTNGPPPPPPVTNNNCTNAIALALGVPTAGTNVNANNGPEPIGNCGAMGNDVWYSVTFPCGGNAVATTCQGAGTTMDTVVAVWDGTGGCGALTPIACNDDTPLGCPGGGSGGLASYVTWNATPGTQYFLSIGGFASTTGNFTVLVTSSNAFNLSFFSNGMGNIGYQLTGGPAGASCFTAVTLNAGVYPAGWFFGIDVGFAELASEFNTGFPFIATLGAGSCPGVTVGPFGPLPSGLQLYGTSVVLPLGGAGPVTASPPATGIVP
jgi:hypothetical protein